jgi:ABC-type nitrate/sulfonate/bicarbonate transport system ATPase subunit
LIRASQFHFAYPDGTVVFDRFSWTVRREEAWAILGPSGCGKTTLLHLLAGLRRPTSGTIFIEDQPLIRPRPRTGLILQDFGLLPWATVWENAALGLRLWGFYGPDEKHAPGDEIVERVAERVNAWLGKLGLDEVSDHYPSQLSGGQRQRTAIARTLALNPNLLLMDEPFAALDAPTREELQNFTLTLRREGKLTTVIVTHTIEEAAILGKKILILGNLPNSDTRIFLNPGSGDDSYRYTSEYGEVCGLLRNALEPIG